MGQVGRRQFLKSAGALVAAQHISARAAERVYRVAIVFTVSPVADMAGIDPVHPLARAIFQELRVLGFVEGRNLVIERRSALGDPGRYRPIVDELVGLKPDVILLAGDRQLIRAAQEATRSVPLVLLGYPTAVEDGFVESLAHPGGNITGRSAYPSWDINGKSLALLKATVPSLSRLAVLAASDDSPAIAMVLREAAMRLRVELVTIELDAIDPRRSFAAVAAAQVHGVFVTPSSLAYAQHEVLGRMAVRARLPGMFPYGRIVEAGGLMSYGLNLEKDIRKVARFVDRIVKGANPGDLPMENATEIELVINLNTAKLLGLTIPQSILLRADRVIE